MHSTYTCMHVYIHIIYINDYQLKTLKLPGENGPPQPSQTCSQCHAPMQCMLCAVATTHAQAACPAGPSSAITKTAPKLKKHFATTSKFITPAAIFPHLNYFLGMVFKSPSVVFSLRWNRVVTAWDGVSMAVPPTRPENMHGYPTCPLKMNS